MPKIITYNTGQLIGNYGSKFIRELESKLINGVNIRTAEFECGYCNNLFHSRIDYVKSGSTKSCGCQTEKNKKDGLNKRRTTRIKYVNGQVLGPHGVKFIIDVDTKYTPSGKSVRLGKFLCPQCGNVFETNIARIKDGSYKGCGCSKGKDTIHGLTNHKLYGKWLAIKTRVFNKNTNYYHHYGGRGITLYGPWINDPESFIEYCIKLPNWDTPGYSIDRIDNDGNYEPGNIRFVDNYKQNQNRRKNNHD